jgi:type II secretory pathway predicted ATPase ExeA
MNLPKCRSACPTVDHAAFREALDLAHVLASMARPGSILFVTGPTGVGKTYLLEALEDLLVGKPESWKNGFIPLVHVDLDVNASGIACMRTLALELNRALGNPFCGVSASPIDAEATTKFKLRLHHSDGDLRTSFRSLVPWRKTRFVVIDEVQQVNTSKMEAATARFDSIKMLAGCSEARPKPGSVVLIICGHYSLLKLMKANRQLARRITLIPMRTYQSQTSGDVLAWESMLAKMAKIYPIPSVRIREWNEVLFEMAVGNFGLLKNILERADCSRLLRKAKEICIDDLIAAVPTNRMYASLKLEMAEAEKALANDFWTNRIKQLLVSPGSKRKTTEKESGAARVASSGRRGVRKNGPRDKVRRIA